jgi:tRNA modification GTPase
MGMYSTEDTIAAVSSPSLLPGQAGRTILRISGDKAFSIFDGRFSIFCFDNNLKEPPHSRGIYPFRVHLSEGIRAEGMAYCFIAPVSYTGQDLVELHLTAAQPVAELFFQGILNAGIRQAGPGEFTQRAYLNGKFDLSQAEAVMHLVAAGSQSQITAAQRLLGGGLALKTSWISNSLLELLSLLEAGLDFPEEDIEFISPQQACGKIKLLSSQIQNLLDGAVRCEELMDLPSVGLAGLPGAGKSSLMNTLTASQRSLVSDSPATTRDILTELLELPGGRCVLFDCAGLKEQNADTLDQLANQAALGALQSAAAVIFCVDMTSHNLQDAAALFRQLGAKTCIAIGTKADKFDEHQIQQTHQKLKDLFGIDFLLTSAATGDGLESLKNRLAETLLSVLSGRDEADPQIAINLRHRQRLESALKQLTQVAEEIYNGNSEVAALLLRQTRQELAGLEHEHIDERILDVIFSKFCIGK